MAEGVKKIEAKYDGILIKNFLAIPNTVVMMMLKGVNLILKPKIPQVIFPTVEKAIEAAKQEIAGW